MTDTLTREQIEAFRADLNTPTFKQTIHNLFPKELDAMTFLNEGNALCDLALLALPVAAGTHVVVAIPSIDDLAKAIYGATWENARHNWVKHWANRDFDKFDKIVAYKQAEIIHAMITAAGKSET